jgi:hypothetical protein
VAIAAFIAATVEIFSINMQICHDVGGSGTDGSEGSPVATTTPGDLSRNEPTQPVNK